MESKKLKLASLFIVSVFLIGILANVSFMSATTPKASQDATLDVDGHPLSITGDPDNDINTNEVDIAMDYDILNPGVDIATDQGDLYQASIDVYGNMFLSSPDFGMTAGADTESNETLLSLMDLGTVTTDLTDNTHTLFDAYENYEALLDMEMGHFGFNDTTNPDMGVTIDILPDMFIILFTDSLGEIIIHNDGLIENTILGGILPAGVEGSAVVPALPGGINVTRYHNITIVEYYDMKVVYSYNTHGIIDVYFGTTFFVTIVDCWGWIFSPGYVIFGWWSTYGWIWFEFYSWWWLYELIYIFIWEAYDIKIEVYYLEIEMIYFVVTWSSLTIFIWYYLDIIIWEFKFVFLFWIFHWQITWNITWFWWFNIYYIYWILPVVTLYVPILYIPYVVDIDVYEEVYDAENDVLSLTYELTDLYGAPVIGATVDVTVESATHPATEIGSGLYQVSVQQIDTADPIDIQVNAVVPNVALVDSLDYTLDIDEYCPVCPPDGSIPGYYLVPLLLVSGAAVFSIAIVIRKKMRVN